LRRSKSWFYLTVSVYIDFGVALSNSFLSVFHVAETVLDYVHVLASMTCSCCVFVIVGLILC